MEARRVTKSVLSRPAADGPLHGGGRDGATPLATRRWWPLWVVVALIPLAIAGAPLADEDSLTDLLRSVRGMAHVTGHLRWPFLVPLLFCAALHYWCAAVAVQAAAGCRLPIGRRVLAQLAASTANRITPAGLGGAAVNVRFLSINTDLSVAAATSTVAVLAVLGSVSDLLLLGALLGVATLVGTRLPSAEFAALRHRLGALLTGIGVTSLVLLLIAALVVAVVLAERRRRAGSDGRWARLVQAAVDAREHFFSVLHRPAAFTRLVLASAGTTLLMGVAFTAAVYAVPYPAARVAPLLIVLSYMLGAAAGSAAPAPAAFGVTEAGLVAALTFCKVPTGHAVAAVLVFRLVTFWIPAIAGLIAARTLRAGHYL